MTKDEYTKRLEDLLGEYHIVKYENIDGYTRIASSETDWYELKKAIQQLNNEAINEDELNPFGKPRINPYSCDECGAPEEPYTRNQLRQELRNILGASNEQS